MNRSRRALTALSFTTSLLMAACGGGDAPADDGNDDGGGALVLTCNTAAYAAGTVELPTAAQLTAYAGTYNGDEGNYDGSGNFAKSGSATLAFTADGHLAYKA